MFYHRPTLNWLDGLHVNNRGPYHLNQSCFNWQLVLVTASLNIVFKIQLQYRGNYKVACKATETCDLYNFYLISKKLTILRITWNYWTIFINTPIIWWLRWPVWLNYGEPFSNSKKFICCLLRVSVFKNRFEVSVSSTVCFLPSSVISCLIFAVTRMPLNLLVTLEPKPTSLENTNKR